MGKFKEPKPQDPFMDPIYKSMQTRAPESKVQAIVKRAMEIQQSPNINPTIYGKGQSFKSYGGRLTIGTTVTTLRFEGKNAAIPNIAIGTKTELDFREMVDMCLVRATKFTFMPEIRFIGHPKKYEAKNVAETLSFQHGLHHGGYSETKAPNIVSKEIRLREAVAAEHMPRFVDFSNAHADFLFDLLINFNPELALPLPENTGGEAI